MSACIEWTGAKDSHGYGNQWFQGRYRKAHQVAWIKANGPIEPGLMVLHRCDNPPCINVEHLFLGTQKDNMADAATKGRIRNGREERTHCPQGHPYDGDNLYVTTKGARGCRTCRRAWTLAYYHRTKVLKGSPA